MVLWKSTSPKRDSPPPYTESPLPNKKSPLPKRKYRHTVYVLHPVRTQSSRFSMASACCVHDEKVTERRFWGMDWKYYEKDGLSYCWNSMAVLCERVPYRFLSVTVEEAITDVEDARAAGKEVSLNKAVIDRFNGLENTRVGERWDLYTVDVLSDWPTTLRNPDPEPEPEHRHGCVMM